jgi:molybdopterin-guanine dinucleotide biosynthesis protein A
MGRNKAFLFYRGRMFLWIIIEALTPLFRDLILVTREPDLYRGFPVRTATDHFEEKGPLSGIHSGLLASQDQKNVVVGCDMPFIQTVLLQCMVRMSEGYDAVIPRVKKLTGNSSFCFEPLHAVYDQGCIPWMEQNLREGRRNLQQLIRNLNVRYLSESEMNRLDPKRNSYRNINTPEAYENLATETFETG